jgi:hypothetical protein
MSQKEDRLSSLSAKAKFTGKTPEASYFLFLIHIDTLIQILLFLSYIRHLELLYE